jgi:hypothetical protein
MNSPIIKRIALFLLSLKNSILEKANPAAIKLKTIRRQSLGKFTGSIALTGATKRHTDTDASSTYIPKYLSLARESMSRAYIVLS